LTFAEIWENEGVRPWWITVGLANVEVGTTLNWVLENPTDGPWMIGFENSQTIFDGGWSVHNDLWIDSDKISIGDELYIAFRVEIADSEPLIYDTSTFTIDVVPFPYEVRISFEKFRWGWTNFSQGRIQHYSNRRLRTTMFNPNAESFIFNRREISLLEIENWVNALDSHRDGVIILSEPNEMLVYQKLEVISTNIFVVDRFENGVIYSTNDAGAINIENSILFNVDGSPFSIESISRYDVWEVFWYYNSYSVYWHWNDNWNWTFTPTCDDRVYYINLLSESFTGIVEEVLGMIISVHGHVRWEHKIDDV